MIVSVKMNDEKVEALLMVLRKHIKALGWTIANIIGIIPGICTYKITLQERRTPFIEHNDEITLYVRGHIEINNKVVACRSGVSDIG